MSLTERKTERGTVQLIDDSVTDNTEELANPTVGYQFSRHALKRWDQRTPSSSVSPETALRRSTSLETLRLDQEFHCSKYGYTDVLRAYGGVGENERSYTPIFIIHEDTVATILNTTRVSDPAVKAYIEATITYKAGRYDE